MKRRIKGNRIGPTAVAFVLTVLSLSTYGLGFDGSAIEKFVPVQSIGTVRSAKLSPASRMQMIVGKEFVIAKTSASYKDRGETALNRAAVDVLKLIRSLGDAPEVTDLNTILVGILDAEKSGATTAIEIERLFEKYSDRQVPDAAWYANIGANASRMIFSSFYDDEAALRKETNAMASLIKLAPPGASEEVVASIKRIMTCVSPTAITSKQMEEITRGGLEFFRTIETGGVSSLS